MWWARCVQKHTFGSRSASRQTRLGLIERDRVVTQDRARHNVVGCKILLESAMLRSLPILASLLTACTPSPQKAAMPTATPSLASPAQAPDTPAEAAGRRTISTAFVRVGPDGHMTVELRNGRVLVLRNVAVRSKDYCGVEISRGADGAKFCGGFAEVVSARPGGVPPAPQPDIAASGTAAPADDSAAGKR